MPKSIRTSLVVGKLVYYTYFHWDALIIVNKTVFSSIQLSWAKNVNLNIPLFPTEWSLHLPDGRGTSEFIVQSDHDPYGWARFPYPCWQSVIQANSILPHTDHRPHAHTKSLSPPSDSSSINCETIGLGKEWPYPEQITSRSCFLSAPLASVIPSIDQPILFLCYILNSANILTIACLLTRRYHAGLSV